MWRQWFCYIASKSIENTRFDIIINIFPYTAKSMKCCVREYFLVDRIEIENLAFLHK